LPKTFYTKIPSDNVNDSLKIDPVDRWQNRPTVPGERVFSFCLF